MAAIERVLDFSRLLALAATLDAGTVAVPFEVFSAARGWG